VDQVSLYDIPFGIGVDIYLPEKHFFKAQAYYDANGKDLLLALTNTEKEEITYLTEGLDPVIWARLSDRDNSMVVGTNRNIENISTRDNSDNAYERVKDKMRFDVVVIDPGHGGHDPGSIGYKGVEEKDIVLSISKKVGGYIEEYLPNVKVVYTREDDTFIDLEERGPIANKAGGDLFVSIHANKFHNRQPHGTETYFLGLERSETALEVMKRENNIINGDEPYDPDKVLSPEELLVYELQNSGYIATSEKIAGRIEDQFANRAQRKSRGVKQGRFVVLYQASMPAILIETGFLSNPSEQRFLSSDYGQSIIASAIFRAIRNYKEEYEKSQHFNTN
jgi:N-acetylmuramoyl-L-alanine amidase